METRRKAAEEGDATSQFVLGRMYAIGLDVLQDTEQAAFWYRRAADQGHVVAQFNLGVMYTVGRGVSRDYVEAHRWLSIAASQVSEAQYPDFAKVRDDVEERLSSEDLAEVQKRAREWMTERGQQDYRVTEPAKRSRVDISSARPLVAGGALSGSRRAIELPSAFPSPALSI